MHSDFLKNNSEERVDVLRQLDNVTTSLHMAGFCHGDLRAPNILVRARAKVCVLDFEWSGRLGTATYPFFMNHEEIAWPEGAQDGKLIAKEHDKFWVSALVKEYS